MQPTAVMSDILRVNVLGVGISAINMAQAINTIDAWVERGERQYVCVTGVHGVMESQRDPSLRQIHNRAGLVTPDGMPMVWLSHLHGRSHVAQVCGSELMLAVCGHSQTKGYRHFFYGGAEGVPERLAERLAQRFPQLSVAGTYSPPFRALSEAEDEEIVSRINAANPDIVWVGLSTPKQERWMAANRDRLQASALFGVGAAFDFHAGLKKRAPRWMQRSGLEWFHRFLSEPRRLWRRYLINNPAFVYHVMLQTVAGERYQPNT